MARRDTRPDPKEAALAGARCLNPHPEQVTDPEFLASDFFDARDAVQVKYEMVRKVRAGGAPVTEAAAAFGYSRPAYYAAAAALESSGLDGLVPARPGPRGASKLTAEPGTSLDAGQDSAPGSVLDARYEQLRHAALHARAEAFPLGLGVLTGSGVTAWRHALAGLTSARPQDRAAPAFRPPGTQPAPASGLPVPVAAELISALAAVALAGTITGPPP